MGDAAHETVTAKTRVAPRPALPAAELPTNPPALRRTTAGRRLPSKIRDQGLLAVVRLEDAISREALRGRGFLFVPVCMGAGAVAWFSMEAPPSPAALLLAFAGLAIAALRTRHGPLAAHHALAALALFVGGMVAADIQTWRRGTVVLDSPVTTVATGIVERREAGARGEWRYVVRIAATMDPHLKRPPERVSLLARAKHAPFALGEAVSGRVRLSPPSGPVLPGRNDFAFSSYFNGIGAVGYFLGAPTRPAGESAPPRGWVDAADRWLFTLRDDISTRIRTVITGDSGAFAASIITGERRSMSNELTEALRLSGLAHITAISGLNMALAAGIFFVGLRMGMSLFPSLAQSYPVKKFAASGALIGALCYLMISGYQVSAVRAFLMTAIMLVAILFDRPAISLRNLALAAIVILVVSPSEVMGPSFQMSFAATAALIAGYAAWRERPVATPLPANFPGARIGMAVWRFAAGTMVTSLIGGLSTAVFAISHFHRLAPHSLEANLAAMPIISLWVMPAGLAAMLLMPFGLDGPFLFAMGKGLEYVGDIAVTIAGWGEGYGFPRLGWWFLPAIVAGLLLLTLLGTWLRHAGTLMILLSIAVAALSPPMPLADIVIAEDGSMVGLPDAAQDAIATNRKKPPSFVFKQWQQALQLRQHQPPLAVEAAAHPSLTAKTDPPDRLSAEDIAMARKAMATTLRQAMPGRFSCQDKQWCVARPKDGWSLALIENPALVGAGCDIADIVVTTRRIGFQSCRSGAWLITSETLRRSGSVEIHLAATGRDMIVHTAFSKVGRPWMRHRLYDWRSDRFLPSDASPTTIISDSGE